MITIRALSKAFGGHQVLRSIDMSVEKGKIVGLAGPNACGKSTLIKSILGLVNPDSGTIEVLGVPSTDYRARSEIGYMPQHADYPQRLTPREVFKLISKLKNRAPTRQAELLDKFRLSEYLDQPCGKLSVGTRQKVSAVGALMCEPRALILDEPTASFDPLASFTFKQLLMTEVQRGTAVLIVSHIISELAQLIDELIFMLDGRALYQGPVADLVERSGTNDLEHGIISLMKNGHAGNKAPVR